MAELKTLGRQVGQPGAPDVSGFAKGHAILGQVAGNIASQAATTLVEQRKTALEIEKASSILSAQQQMTSSLRKSLENPKANEQTLMQFKAEQSGIIEGTLKGVSRENFNDVKIALSKSAFKDDEAIYNHVLDANKRAIKDNDATLFYQGSKQLEELAIQGDSEAFNETFESINAARKKLVETGNLSQLDYAKGFDEMLQAGINGKLRHDYNAAFAKGGERAAAQFMNDFWENPPEGMTQDQKNQGLKELISIASQDKAAMTQVSNAGYRDIVEAINSPYGPQSENEVKALIETAGESGYPLSEWQAFKALEKFRKKHSTEIKRQESNFEIAKQVSSSDTNALIAQDTQKLDNYYIDTKKAIAEKAAQDVENAQTPNERIMAQRPEWMIGAAIAAEVPIAIRQWRDEVSAKVHSQNVDDVLNAVKAYNYVETKNKAAVKGFNAKDEAFIKSVQDDLENTTMTPNEIVQRYKDSILNVDPQVEENRNLEYKNLIKDNPNLPNDIVKKAFGTKVSNKLKEPSATLYATAQKQLEKEFKLTGNEKQAIKNAVQYLKDNGGESMFAPKNDVVWNPPENLPFYDFGNIVRNQSSKYLNEVIKNAEQNPGRLPYSIEKSSKMPDFPSQLSEEDLFKGKYDKGEWWLKIDGVDRQVFFISPNYNQSNAFAQTQYMVMFEKDGRLQNLMVANPVLAPNGKIQHSVGNALMAYNSPNELTPNLIKNMQEEAYNANVEKSSGRAYRSSKLQDYEVDVLKQNKTKHGFSSILSRVNKDKVNKEKYIEKAKKELPHRIEQEKLRRLSEEVKKS